MKKGFTLIELLIVIAIIGILAVALLPQLLSAPASARDTAKQAAINQIAVALEQYNASSGQYPVAATGGDCLDASSTATKTALIPYFKNNALPAIDVPKAFDSAAIGPTTCSGYFYCKLAGNRYYLGVAMESPAVAGKGHATLSPAGKLSSGCDGTGAVPTTITTVATNGYGILN